MEPTIAMVGIRIVEDRGDKILLCVCPSVSRFAFVFWGNGCSQLLTLDPNQRNGFPDPRLYDTGRLVDTRLTVVLFCFLHPIQSQRFTLFKIVVLPYTLF